MASEKLYRVSALAYILGMENDTIERVARAIRDVGVGVDMPGSPHRFVNVNDAARAAIEAVAKEIRLLAERECKRRPGSSAILYASTDVVRLIDAALAPSPTPQG